MSATISEASHSGLTEPIVGARLVNGALSGRTGRLQRRAILRDGACNEIIDRQHLGHPGGRMPRAPDVAPAPRAPLARARCSAIHAIDGVHQLAGASDLSKPLGTSISTSSVDTCLPLSILTTTFSGSI